MDHCPREETMTKTCTEKAAAVSVPEVLRHLWERFWQEDMWLNGYEITWIGKSGVRVPADPPYCLFIGELDSYGCVLLRAPIRGEQEPSMVPLANQLQINLIRRMKELQEFKPAGSKMVTLEFLVGRETQSFQIPIPARA